MKEGVVLDINDLEGIVEGLEIEHDEDGKYTGVVTFVMNIADIPDVQSFGEMVPLIKGKLSEEMKPTSKLVKSLERIVHHKDQLYDAVVNLCGAYNRLVHPSKAQGRVSSVVKAQRDMLNAMPVKALWDFARVYVEDIDDYVRPDDKDIVINKIIAAMATLAAKDEEEEVVGVSGK